MKDKHKVLIDKQIEDFNKIWSDVNKPIVVEQFEGVDDNKEFIYLIEVSFNEKRRTNLFRYGEEGSLTWESVHTHIQHRGGIQGCYETAVNMLRDFDVKYDDEKYPSTLDEVFKPKVIGGSYTKTPDFLGDTEEERYERQLELKKQGIELIETVMIGDIVDLKQINTKTPEGKLLMAALAFITTSNRTNKTPYEVIEELNLIKNDMYNKK